MPLSFRILNKIFKIFSEKGGYLFLSEVLTIKIHSHKTFTTMKKLLLVLAIGAFASCGGNSSDTTTDSTSTTDTTSTMMSPAPTTADTGSAMSADTSKMSTDTTKK